MQYRVSWIWACAIAWALSACTTPVGPVVRDQSYQKKLTETMVVWAGRSALPVRMHKTSSTPQPLFTDSERQASRLQAEELTRLFNDQGHAAVEQALKERQVRVLKQDERPATRLILNPTIIDAGCAFFTCQASMMIQATLQDESSFQVLWSASFKVGAPFPLKHDEGVVKDFARNVMYGLKEAGLL